jgi:hypothetical protein
MIIIYVYDASLLEYRKITYGEVKKALEMDISSQGINGYGTGSPGAYANLPKGIIEPQPKDDDQVTFSGECDPNFIMNGLSQLGLKFKSVESGQEGFPEVLDIAKVIKLEISIDPISRDYSKMKAEERVASLNAKNRPILKERFVTARTFLSEFDPKMAADIYGKLKTASASDSLIEMVWDMITTYSAGGGIDICHLNTQLFIDTMVSKGVLTSEEGDCLKSLAFTSRAKELIGRDVVLTDVSVESVSVEKKF